MSDYSIERQIRVYNDMDGSCISVSPDADGLDLVEIRNVDDQNRITQRIVLSREQAVLVAQALAEYCADDRNFPAK